MLFAGVRQMNVRTLDIDAGHGVDPRRLERSLGLRAERMGEGRYRVSGGAESHWVDLYSRRTPRCDCGDHLWRDRVCKHILSALLREGDPRVIGAVASLVGQLRDMAKAA